MGQQQGADRAVASVVRRCGVKVCCLSSRAVAPGVTRGGSACALDGPMSAWSSSFSLKHRSIQQIRSVGRAARSFHLLVPSVRRLPVLRYPLPAPCPCSCTQRLSWRPRKAAPAPDCSRPTPCNTAPPLPSCGPGWQHRQPPRQRRAPAAEAPQQQGSSSSRGKVACLSFPAGRPPAAPVGLGYLGARMALWRWRVGERRSNRGVGVRQGRTVGAAGRGRGTGTGRPPARPCCPPRGSSGMSRHGWTAVSRWTWEEGAEGMGSGGQEGRVRMAERRRQTAAAASSGECGPRLRCTGI